MSVTYPVLMPMAWASGAGGHVGTNNAAALQASTASAAPTYMSLNDGIPIDQMTPGGVPSQGGDMNGILNWITSFQTWVNAGGLFRYNSTLSTAIGGYPIGSLLVSSSLNQAYLCNNAAPINPNPNNPDSSLAGWQYAFGNVVGTAASVTASSSTDGTMYWSTGLGLCLQGKGSTNQFSLMSPSGAAALMQMTLGTLYFPIAPIFSQKMSFTPYANAAPTANDVWLDSARGTLCLEGGAGSNKVKNYIPGVLAVMSANPYTVNLTLASTVYDILALANMTGVTTLPANFFVAGRTIKLEMHMLFSAAGACTLLLPVSLGGAGLNASLVVASAANYYIKLQATFTVATPGSSAPFFMGVDLVSATASGAGTVFYLPASGFVDTTGTLLLDVTADASITGCTVKVSSATLTVLG